MSNYEEALLKIANEEVKEKEVWNDAIEEAAKCVDSWTTMDQAGYDFGPALEIRKLKK